MSKHASSLPFIFSRWKAIKLGMSEADSGESYLIPCLMDIFFRSRRAEKVEEWNQLLQCANQNLATNLGFPPYETWPLCTRPEFPIGRTLPFSLREVGQTVGLEQGCLQNSRLQTTRVAFSKGAPSRRRIATQNTNLSGKHHLRPWK